ncbi:MAG: 50S ribosomal protein L6 [Planctomycetota bacterium]
MSRLGKTPIELPKGVTLDVADRKIRAKGPKGELELELHAGISVAIEDGRAQLSVPEGREQELSALYGLDRALLANVVTGVATGYTKELEIVGTGYLAKLAGNKLEIQIGFCHPVIVEIPKVLDVQVPTPTQIVVSGIDKQKVGDFAANIRKIRKPEPYKGKGIRYKGETVKIKPGKQLGAGG